MTLDETSAATRLSPDVEALLGGGQLMDSKFLLRKTDGVFCGVADVWGDFSSGSERVYANVSANGERRPTTIDLNFRNPEQRYQIATDVGLVDLTRVRIEADLWVETQPFPMVDVIRYSSGVDLLAESIHYQITIDAKSHDLVVSRAADTGQVVLELDSKAVS